MFCQITNSLECNCECVGVWCKTGILATQRIAKVLDQATRYASCLLSISGLGVIHAMDSGVGCRGSACILLYAAQFDSHVERKCTLQPNAAFDEWVAEK